MEAGPNSKLHVIQRRLHNSKFALKNHLLSVHQDASFVECLASLFPSLPIIANLRNGLWYTERKSSTCYFKSTDGHVHNWAFSSSRLNVKVALKSCQHGGCIIVDSTRRGKKFPDSMSYTIPIWCAVLNHLVLGTSLEDSLRLPPWVSHGLSLLVNERLVTLVENLQSDIRALLLSSLRGILVSPLRPIWCTVDEGMFEWLGDLSEEFVDNFEEVSSRVVPIVLFSCSDDISENTHSEYHSWHYIKGAGDDEEHWSNGLTPDLFWKNKDILTSEETSETEVVSLVAEILSSASVRGDVATHYVADVENNVCSYQPPLHLTGTPITMYCLDSWLEVSTHDAPKFDGIMELRHTQHIASNGKADYCFIPCPSIDKSHKKVLVDIESIIVDALSFYERLLCSASKLPGGPELAILCEDDKSIGLVVVVSILFAFFHKPVPPSGDISLALEDTSRECLFRVNSAELHTTKVMAKSDIRFISSIVQMLCPEVPQLSRGLVQEITKFFLSPNQCDLKTRLACAANSGDDSAVKGTVRSSWDKLSSSFRPRST